MKANIPGGFWFGKGIEPNTGEFFPNLTGIGTHRIIYNILGECPNSDTIFINVTDKIEAIIDIVPPLCAESPSFQLKASPQGGA